MNGLNCVVVRRNDYVDVVWVGVCVDYGNDWDVKFLGFFNCNLFFVWVYDV